MDARKIFYCEAAAMELEKFGAGIESKVRMK
jgi:hypothetical protein